MTQDWTIVLTRQQWCAGRGNWASTFPAQCLCSRLCRSTEFRASSVGSRVAPRPSSSSQQSYQHIVNSYVTFLQPISELHVCLDSRESSLSFHRLVVGFGLLVFLTSILYRLFFSIDLQIKPFTVKAKQAKSMQEVNKWKENKPCFEDSPFVFRTFSTQHADGCKELRRSGWHGCTPRSSAVENPQLINKAVR